MKLLTLRQIAERLSVGTSSVRRWIDAGEFPPASVLLGP